MEKNLDWQIGSTHPPKVCLCCGMPFDHVRAIRGPYYGGPYIWVCSQCWDNPALFFPDKVQDGSIKKTETRSNQAELMQLVKPVMLKRADAEIHPDGNNAAEAKLRHRISVTPDRTIDAELADVPLSKIKLDGNNVRFKHHQKALDGEEMMKLLWDEHDMNMQELYNEIIYSQGLTEPPILDANYIVREGNRRVACLRRIAEEIRNGTLSISLRKIDPVRCIVLSNNTVESDIAVYLARVHVSGKKEWRVLNQATHIYDLHNIHGFDLEDIRRAISKSKSEIICMEKAYKLTLEYHQQHNDDDSWLGRYSYFYELVKSNILKEWSANLTNLKRFMKWINKGQVIQRGTDVRLLAKIVETNDKELNKMLLKGNNIEEIYRLATGEDANKKNSVFKVINKTHRAVKKLSRDELSDIAENEHKIKVLKRFYTEIGTLIKDVEAIKTK